MAKLLVKLPSGVEYMTLDMGGQKEDELAVVEEITYYETKRYGDSEYTDPIEKQIVLAKYNDASMQFWSPDKASFVKKESEQYHKMVAQRDEEHRKEAEAKKLAEAALAAAE